MSQTICLLVLFLGVALSEKCPTQKFTVSEQDGVAISQPLSNPLSVPVHVYWLDFSGQEQFSIVLGAGDTEVHNSFTGHVFRFKNTNDLLIGEYKVDATKETIVVSVCDGWNVDEADLMWLFDEGRDEEFQALVDENPFDCEGPSAKWSCVRALSAKTVAKRDRTMYGFSDGEPQGSRKTYDQKDERYMNHIALMPQLSATGFLKMKYTNKMKKFIDFYQASKKQGKLQKHEAIGGDYSNIHKVGMDKLNLDLFPKEKAELISEMKQVLQWWTQRTLKHTSTFGIRVYRRDAMLINHVDRADTHLASAVIQVAQECDEGWPLEVLTPGGTTIEVYLQPGEMVLYEGARLFHGRPMRFQGSEFANVFTHFQPTTWVAVGKPWKDPLKNKDKDKLPAHADHKEL